MSDFLEARFSLVDPRRFADKPATPSAFGSLAPGDVLIDHLHKTLSALYAKNDSVLQAAENLSGIVAGEIADMCVRHSIEIENVQAKLRRFEGCSEDEVEGST